MPNTASITATLPNDAASNEVAVDRSEQPFFLEAWRDNRRPIHPSWLSLSNGGGDRDDLYRQSSRDETRPVSTPDRSQIEL